MSEWEIVAVNRETGAREQVCKTTDYSNVSDFMLNDGEESRDYERMELYRDGKLDEEAYLIMPRGINWGWILFVAVIAIAALAIMAQH